MNVYMAKNSEVVEATAEVIEKYGWTRGNYGNDMIGYCLMGAGIRAAVDLGLGGAVVPMAVTECIRPGLPDSFVHYTVGSEEPIILFNDRRTTSKEDVLGVLDRAAKHWRDLGE